MACIRRIKCKNAYNKTTSRCQIATKWTTEQSKKKKKKKKPSWRIETCNESTITRRRQKWIAASNTNNKSWIILESRYRSFDRNEKHHQHTWPENRASKYPIPSQTYHTAAMHKVKTNEWINIRFTREQKITTTELHTRKKERERARGRVKESNLKWISWHCVRNTRVELNPAKTRTKTILNCIIIIVVVVCFCVKMIHATIRMEPITFWPASPHTRANNFDYQM